MRYAALLILTAFLSFPASAQEVKIVSTEYEYEVVHPRYCLMAYPQGFLKVQEIDAEGNQDITFFYGAYRFILEITHDQKYFCLRGKFPDWEDQ